jgi:FixJ family two-component response regulator
LTFIIDDDDAVCRVIAMILAEFEVEVRIFHTAAPALAAFAGRHPRLIFLDIALAGADAVHVIEGLKGANYGGVIQLITGGNPLLVEVVERIGTRHGLAFLPALQKPFRREVVRDVIRKAIAGLGYAASAETSASGSDTAA